MMNFLIKLWARIFYFFFGIPTAQLVKIVRIYIDGVPVVLGGQFDDKGVYIPSIPLYIGKHVRIVYSTSCPFPHYVDTVITGEIKPKYTYCVADFGITTPTGLLSLEFLFEYPCEILRIVTSPRTFGLYRRIRNRIRRWL